MDKMLFSGPGHSGRIVQNILGSRFNVELAEATPADLLPKFEQCTVFLDASMKVRIPARSIEQAFNLKLVVTATTGANHIDREALDERGIPLLTLKDQKEFLRNITPAAEHSWLLLMACARRLRGAMHHVEDGKWDRVEFPGTLFRGKTLGIIGLGRIGSWMARYANAFDMNVQACDPYATEIPEGVRMVEIDELLKSSDFITVHVHLSEETSGFLHAGRIKSMKPGCIFVNTSRGELADEKALVEELITGRIAAAGFDVLTDEPELMQNLLWQYAQGNQNVIITPHIGGYSPEAVDKVVEFSCRRILDYFNR